MMTRWVRADSTTLHWPGQTDKPCRGSTAASSLDNTPSSSHTRPLYGLYSLRQFSCSCQPLNGAAQAQTFWDLQLDVNDSLLSNLQAAQPALQGMLQQRVEHPLQVFRRQPLLQPQLNVLQTAQRNTGACGQGYTMCSVTQPVAGPTRAMR